MFSFLFQRFLEVISDCLSRRYNGHTSLRGISVLINRSVSIRLVLFRTNPLVFSLNHKGKGIDLTNATATQDICGREQL